MYIEYDDILTRVAERPLWWLNGIPRYEPFQPRDVHVHAREVALVQTECQECRTRYDVAVEPKGYGRSLRNVIAYENSLDIGDPPNACPSPNGRSHPGATMSSIQIAVLEFWDRERGLKGGWQRDSSMERPLVDADWDLSGKVVPPKPVFLRVQDSERRDEWRQAYKEGNYLEMASILTFFGCERPKEVAHMLDTERRHRLFLDELGALREERFGKG